MKGRADRYEASDVVKLDMSTALTTARELHKFEVGATVTLKGVQHLVVWLDRDKGLAGVCKSPRHFINERRKRRSA